MTTKELRLKLMQGLVRLDNTGLLGPDDRRLVHAQYYYWQEASSVELERLLTCLERLKEKV